MKSDKVDFFPSYFVGLSGRLGWALKCGLVPVGGVLVPCEESRRPAADEPSVSRGSSRSTSSSSSSSSCSAGIDFVHLHRLLLRGAAHKALPSGLRQQQQHATEQFLSSDNPAVLSSVSGEVSGDRGRWTWRGPQQPAGEAVMQGGNLQLDGLVFKDPILMDSHLLPSE